MAKPVSIQLLGMNIADPVPVKPPLQFVRVLVFATECLHHAKVLLYNMRRQLLAFPEDNNDNHLIFKRLTTPRSSSQSSFISLEGICQIRPSMSQRSGCITAAYLVCSVALWQSLCQLGLTDPDDVVVLPPLKPPENTATTMPENYHHNHNDQKKYHNGQNKHNH